MSICLEAREPFHFFPTGSTDCSSAGGDIQFDGGDFAQGSGLQSAVMLQILTDKGRDGGWWGAFDDDFEIGSELWRLRSNPSLDASALLDAERYIREAIDPLIAQGMATQYEVNVSVISGDLSIDLTFFDSEGGELLQTVTPWLF